MNLPKGNSCEIELSLIEVDLNTSEENNGSSHSRPNSSIPRISALRRSTCETLGLGQPGICGVSKNFISNEPNSRAGSRLVSELKRIWMRTKRDLVELNWARELHLRLRFVEKRLGETVIELKLARGMASELPEGMQRPPDWALVAAQMAWETGFKRLSELDPRGSASIDADGARELLGTFLSLLSYVQKPPVALSSEPGDASALVMLRRSAGKQISREFIKYLRKLAKATKRKFEVPSLGELAEFNRRYSAGLSGFATPKGDLVGMRTATARIYFLLWFFWPKLKRDLDGPYVHDWLRNEQGESVSDKLVEAILTRLRKGCAELKAKPNQP